MDEGERKKGKRLRREEKGKEKERGKLLLRNNINNTLVEFFETDRDLNRDKFTI